MRTIVTLGCVVAALWSMPSAAAAQGDGDNWTSPTALTLDTPLGAFPNPPEVNLGYGLQPNEPMTANGLLSCLTPAPIKMNKTHWYRFVADGLRTTVSTAESSLDTVIAGYKTAGDPTSGNILSVCSNDISATDLNSRMSFDTERGATYLIQVGGCAGCASNNDEGAFQIVASTPPTNDNQAAPETVGTVAQVIRENRYATLEAGEATQCGNSVYTRTVWFRVQVPAPASALTFRADGGGPPSSSAMDPVIRVYRDGQDLGCNDDRDPQAFGPAEVRLRDAPAGTYLIQVGAYNYPQNQNPSKAIHGPFTLTTDFQEDTDVDNDGDPRRPIGNDCDDRNASVFSGAPEVLDNSVDENCDGVLGVNLDRDRDGINRPNDCDDTNPNIKPGLPEKRGNKVDENCDGIAEPFLSVGTRYSYFARPVGSKARFTALGLKSVPKGATVVVSCKGGGCPKRSYRVKLRKARKTMDLLSAVRGRSLRVGAVVEIRVTVPDLIGRLIRLKIRPNAKVDDSVSCLVPGQKRARRCS